MKVILICQARSTSKRLPKKNFIKIGDKSIIEHHISRLGTGTAVTRIIATPHNEPMIKKYKKIAKKYNWKVENPNCAEDDVLKRFVMICDKYQPDWVIRTTADSPFMDTDWCQQTINLAITNNIPIFNTFKEGSCVEVFPVWCLYRSQIELPDYNNCDDYQKQCREHVTMYFKKGFDKKSIDNKFEYKKALHEYMNNL